MEQVIQAFESNPITAIILTTLIAIIGIYISYNRLVVADKSFKLSKSNFENNKSNFNLYLEDSFRTNVKFFKLKRIILFNIQINNLSQTKNTFTATLEIEYTDNSNKKSIIKISHQPSLKNNLSQKKLSILNKTIRIEEKDIISGWVIFDEPKALRNKRISKYEVVVQDSHKNKASIELNLIKDIVYET